MPKILKIEYNEVHELLYVTTDAAPDRAFLIPINEVSNEAELKARIKSAVEEYRLNKEQEESNEVKVKEMKKLEGEEIGGN